MEEPPNLTTFILSSPLLFQKVPKARSACRFSRGEAGTAYAVTEDCARRRVQASNRRRRHLASRRNAGRKVGFGCRNRHTEMLDFSMSLQGINRHIASRIPLPTRLRRATFPPGEGLFYCAKAATKASGFALIHRCISLTATGSVTTPLPQVSCTAPGQLPRT